MRTLGNGTDRITTALLLAAGRGSRLWPLTDDAPKCLTEVSGTTILERLVCCMRSRGFKRLVVVVGYLDHRIRKALRTSVDGLTIEFIHSPRYRTTNNIYSLWLARNAIQEPFVLIESDLVFDTALLDEMLEPDRIAVSRTLPWMNGTTVSLDPRHEVTRFHIGGPALDEVTYKTVNMYSFSPPSWRRVASRLDQYISAGRVGEYYEKVFAELVAEGSLSFQAAFFDNECWYEIDTLEDLHEAERLFPTHRGRPTTPV
ncbi:MAG: nucleotidyl transferase [Planctomycetaceae bacterium]|nr:nucleotidyl transferase [Planctomycetaceae bacterium]